MLSACAPDPKPAFEAWPAEQRAQTQIELGFSYLQRDQLDVARESFRTALKVDPKSSEAYHGLGLVEALAHCNYLWHAGEASRTLDQDGAYRWVIK